MVQVERTYEPNPEQVPVYQDLYQAYVQSYEALAGKPGVFDTLSRLQGY